MRVRAREREHYKLHVRDNAIEVREKERGRKGWGKGKEGECRGARESSFSPSPPSLSLT